MGENEQFGFVLGGLSKDIGSGGRGCEPRPGMSEGLSKFLDQCGLEKLGPERAAELIFYAVEHQTERWAELYDFFFNEAAALLLEAMEALDGGEDGDDEQQ